MKKAHPIYKQDEAILQPWIDPHKLKRIEGMWYKDGRQVVTNSLEHKHTLIQSHHDPLVYGHPGINRTIRLMERYYRWPQLQKDVADYVRGCAECQQHKVNTRPTKAPLSPIYLKPEALPFETIALDFITKLPMSQGSFPVQKTSMQKKRRHYMLSTLSPCTDYLPKLSAIETLNLLPTSLGNCVTS